MHILVVPLEVGGTPKDLYLSMTGAWILAWELVLPITSEVQISIATIYY
jgi:hypothetical protein